MLLFESTLLLLLGAVLLTGAARRWHVPYPSLLAIAGAALAFVPAGPSIEMEPELALALFIAPVLLDAAFDTPPRELRRNLVPLTSLVLVAVILTTCAVAWVGYRFGGLPVAAAIALGAIVAPPDAAAAAAILGPLRLPRRVVQVLQGESLLNDATALLIYRIAVAATLGRITLGYALPVVLLTVFGSPLAGWVLGRLYLLATARVRDAASSTILGFVGTFGVWIAAERVGLSPVITMAAYAMTLARRAPRVSSARNRISTYSVWETAVFVLNVLAFVIMGLQARPILDRLAQNDVGHALLFAAAVLATVIAVRVVYVMAYNSALRLKHRLAGPPDGGYVATVQSGLLVSWCGMRGLVTLATAFALPHGFPDRDLIVLAAFGVVLGTLVIQGLTLQPLLGRLHFATECTLEVEVSRGRVAMLDAALATLAGDESPAAAAVRAGYLAAREVALDRARPQGASTHDVLRLRAVGAERARLHQLRERDEISDEAFHRLEEEVDWSELDAAPAGFFQPLTTDGEAGSAELQRSLAVADRAETTATLRSGSERT
jgi:CPA1 family monovalent cation:H+ antiporter